MPIFNEFYVELRKVVSEYELDSLRVMQLDWERNNIENQSGITRNSRFKEGLDIPEATARLFENWEKVRSRLPESLKCRRTKTNHDRYYNDNCCYSQYFTLNSI